MSGFVTLLGAGPGDEDLITVKGLERLKEADVIIYDRLVNSALLRHAKPSCELIYVGKIPGGESVSQEVIENTIVEHALVGRRVVRLKSGDPYIFGRGGEEGIELAKHNIRFEVIPGVTSAIAGLTYAGIPATYRNIATSVHVITGHLQDEHESLNWDALSQLKGTLVFLMGMKNLPIITQELMARGHAGSTPVAIVEWGTHVQQRSLSGTLESIVSLVEQHQFGAPSVIVIGKVVDFKATLNFHEQAKLFGKRILVQDSASGKLPRLLKQESATLVTFPPRDKVVSMAQQLPALEHVKGIVVTDSHAWQWLMERLVEENRDIREFISLNIVTIGHHTTKCVQQSGIKPVAIFEQWQSQELRALLTDEWLILAEQARAKRFAKNVDAPILVTHQLQASQVFDPDTVNAKVDVICLPHSLAAETLVLLSQQYDLEVLKQVPIVLMGESTKTVLESAGFTQFVQSEHATIASMIDATVSVFQK